MPVLLCEASGTPAATDLYPSPQEVIVMHVSHGSGPIVAASQDISRRSVVVGLGFAGIAAALAAAGWKVDVLAQDATPVSSPQAMEEFNAIEIIYGHPTDPAAFQDYLHNRHIPIAWELPGLQQLIVHSSMVGVDGVPGDIYQIGTVIFASQAELEADTASEQGQAVVADIASFATGGFAAYLAHVEFLERPDDTGTPEASPGA
jgi:uncharacterized protein (TIGR02118 family)